MKIYNRILNCITYITGWCFFEVIWSRNKKKKTFLILICDCARDEDHTFFRRFRIQLKKYKSRSGRPKTTDPDTDTHPWILQLKNVNKQRFWYLGGRGRVRRTYTDFVIIFQLLAELILIPLLLAGIWSFEFWPTSLIKSNALTDQITELAPYVFSYFLVTVLSKYHVEFTLQY